VTETAEPTAASQGWRLDADTGSMVPRSALDVLVDLNDKVTSGRVSEYQPVPLGFTPLDKTIGTGLRAGELLLIGGAQGTGKTTMALQMARNIASGGQANVLYFFFELDELYLLNRLIAME
jgi:replicative DNA helicase